MTTGKFLHLKYPLRSTYLTKRMAHKICILILIAHLALPLMMLIIDKDDLSFDYRLYDCIYRLTADTWKTLVPIGIITTFFVPNIVIVSTSIAILVMAKRSARRLGGSVQWRGALPVVLTAVVYCVSTLPLFIYFIGSNFVQDSTGTFHVQYYRISAGLSMINIMSNFYIYAMTISSFRGFLISEIFFILAIFSQRFRNMTTSTGSIAINFI